MGAFTIGQVLFGRYTTVLVRMPGGRKPETEDIEILRLIALHPGPGVASTELADLLEMTQQGITPRLASLADDGLVQYRTIGGTNVYTLTLEGQKYVARRLISNYGDDRQ